jgi:hypothetical protein
MTKNIITTKSGLVVTLVDDTTLYIKTDAFGLGTISLRTWQTTGNAVAMLNDHGVTVGAVMQAGLQARDGVRDA